jgi:hypothetical protein
MKSKIASTYIVLCTVFLTLFTSCKKSEFAADNHTAYFGGEVENPQNRYVLFCQNNKVIDTLPLNKDNTFFKKFDSLAPGLYSFKHEPEYQYVYFDKNDSLRVHIDSKDFDQSIVFCGRGDQKNNFLMEMFLRNEKEKNNMFEIYDYDVKKYNAYIQKVNEANRKFYQSKKEEINWTDDFDVYAQGMFLYPHYTRKEIYPIIHKMRTGHDVTHQLPKNYYDFRKSIDFSNEKLTDFNPFVLYLNLMLNNVGSIHYHNHFTEVDLALKTNINKLKIADTLLKNEKVKNIVVNSIAFQYLLEDQNMVNNQEFLKHYYKIATDKSKKNEILKLGKSIGRLTNGKPLPDVLVQSLDGKSLPASKLIQKNTILFFWSDKLSSHLIAAHKKAKELQLKYPNYEFVAINLDSGFSTWKKALEKYDFGSIRQYHCNNFEDIKNKWAITKIHRTLIINKDKTIKNGFTNMFDIRFEDDLK